MKTERAKILVFAYSEVGHACLKLLLDLNENVVAVYTHKDNPGEVMWFPSVLKLAQDHSIPVETVENLKDPAEAAKIKVLAPDLMFSFYYRNLIPLSILKLAKLGAYNMHGSYLPKYRGRAPINWAVLNGETQTGATLHVMTEDPDAGDIVDQEAVSIGLDDTAGMVQSRVTAAATLVLRRQIHNLKMGTAPLMPQNHAQSSYFGRRRPEDGLLNWNWPAARIHNLVRAVTRPYPGAVGEIEGEKGFVWKTLLHPKGVDFGGQARQPGSVEKKGERIFVFCGDGEVIEILEFQKKKLEEIKA